jgi:hypothetical protein
MGLDILLLTSPATSIDQAIEMADNILMDSSSKITVIPNGVSIIVG